MKACVVDASVVGAALFREEHADAARALLASQRALHAPDLIVAEVANIIWKRHARSEIDEAEGQQLLSDFLVLDFQIASAADLAAPALELAMRIARTAYDCLYLALAIKTGSPLVTKDQRLVNTLSGGPFEKNVIWIGQGLPQ
jgi:predicted nucleic acid-binding protein